MLVTIQNLTRNLISTDVGLLNPAETKTLTMSPDSAYRAAQGLKTLSDSGRVTITVMEETALLDLAEPASLGTPVALADNSVVTAKIAAGAVTGPKLGALSVAGAQLAAGAVTAGKVAVGGVSAADQFAAGVVDAAALGTGAVTTAKLGAASVEASKLAVFKSTEQTGTGASQDIAHGLVTVPGLVMILPSGIASATDTFVEGATDATNVKVTASTGAKYFVVAIK